MSTSNATDNDDDDNNADDEQISTRHQCTQCEKTYSHLGNLTRHVLSVHRPRNTHPRIKCLICKRKFSRTDVYWRHMQLKHTDATKTTQKSLFYCRPCNVSFKTIVYLKRHLQRSTRHGARHPN